MKLYSDIKYQHEELDVFSFAELLSPDAAVLRNKIDQCPCDVGLIEKAKIPPNDYDLITRPLKKYKVQVFESSANGEPRYLISFGANKGRGLPPVALHVICNSWQLNSGNIPVHSSAIIHKGGVFLFCAPSGGGKSTIGCLSMELGDQAVDEDQVMIQENQPNIYSANAWAKSNQRSTIPIRAVFKIIKSNEDQLIRLSDLQTSSLLWSQSMESTGGMFSKRNASRLFSNIARFSRSIPGYQLHFRKSPDFWKLIDAEFGLA